MKFLIQRVTHAKCTVNGEVTGEINNGLLVFIGIGRGDTTKIADKMISKLINMRIFEDENEKINLPLENVNGELLLISQFTLYADCKKGNRPSFIESEAPQKAEMMYEYIINQCNQNNKVKKVATGIFGADMKISLENDGPFTIILDSNNLSI
ncbi:D-aminoacyl-tRNA deacylase [Lachnobacterium bovis]|uniref:D-aminoacyl-tRNA deacylase n=1 Tax=Lachnobacterium bovis DSM 14045 TaxID=1122142 RepID=A0A1H3F5S3_9FIRM|nr:D-aminoacyl-tRNA deacylase [Lachnobacterium bovis]MBQ1802028.1 D-tyrosyl-tRNA(Tyr) deacylase [Lachnobacterium sp.]SDX86311.1 D-tyrosyl-tRNA(Tyr) deacylase [Lachnobacterium bovis DSM 14045]